MKKYFVVFAVLVSIALALWFHGRSGVDPAPENTYSSEKSSGDEMLVHDIGYPVRSEARKWTVETDDEAKFRKIAAENILRLEIEKLGRSSWIPQLIATPLHFEKGRSYTFSIRIRAEHSTELSLIVRRNRDPWDDLGLHLKIAVGPEWRDFSYTFEATDTENDARLDISGFSPGTFEFSDSSLKPAAGDDAGKF